MKLFSLILRSYGLTIADCRKNSMKFTFLILLATSLFFSCASTQKNNDVCGDIRTPANAEQCAVLFPQKNSIANPTDAEILKYIDALVIEQLRIQSKKYDNKNQLDQAVDAFSKALNKIMLIDKKYLTVFRQKFAEKSKDYNKNSKSADKEKRELDEAKRKAIEDSLDPINQAKQKIIFHTIKPGKFMMGEIGSQVETIIDQPFSMMSTQFTQMMWARLKIAMGETDINKINPSSNKAGTESQIIKIENFDIQMKPDHPVERVSWIEVTRFIKNLNDLSKIDNFKIQNLLTRLIPEHQKNDVYDLPTSEQWEFVMRDRGNAKNRFFDKSDDSEISKYAWHDTNSGHDTHTVAELLPRMIDGKPFYDMEGNVSELTKDLCRNSTDCHVARGSNYVTASKYSHILSSHWPQQDTPNHAVGFRLVRTNR